MTGRVIVVLVTVPRGKGRDIARRILEKRLAACINVSSVGSLYWWQGSIEEEEEDLLIIKTSSEKYSELERYVREIHPYKVPEIIAVEVEMGFEKYLGWVLSETNATKG